MDQASQPQFEADFSIQLHRSSGLRRYSWVDRHGSVSISDGRLIVRKSTGEMVVEAPVGEVRAYTVHHDRAAEAQIGEETYHFGPLPQDGMVYHQGVLAGISAYREFKRLKRGKENAKRFLREFEAAGGRVCKP